MTRTIPRSALLVSLLSCISIIILSLSVSANPGPQFPPPPDTTFKVTDAVSGLTWLFLLNIIMNLFFLTAFLFLTARVLLDRVGNLPKKAYMFLANVFVLAVVVTVIGAFVDYYLVMGVDPSYDTHARVIVVDAANWILALAVIFLSVALPSMALLRLSRVAALTLAALITAVNPVWWILSDEFGFDVAMFTIIFGLIMLPVLAKGLVDFHNTQESRRVTEASESS